MVEDAHTSFPVKSWSRDLARGAFFQFLREYPQKKSRWDKQVDFIIANLKYPREGGRISVMEVLHLLLTKSAPEFVKEIAASCFFPLVIVIGNDESEKCQLVAGVLIKEIFSKADPAHLKEFLDRMRAWAKNQDNTSVLKLGFQIWSLYLVAPTGPVPTPLVLPGTRPLGLSKF